MVVQSCTDNDHHRTTTPGTDTSDAAMPTTAHDAASPAANSSDEGTGAKEKKGRKGLSLGLKSPFKLGLGGKTQCKVCKKKCSGEVLRVGDAYYHQSCFVCKGCRDQLSQGGFFVKDNDNFCVKCYQSRFGTKCAKCGHFVEGEVVTAMGNTYHTQCFVCGSCGKPFPTGERVTFTGKMCLCQQCMWKAGDNKSHSKDKAHGKENSNANAAQQPVSNGHKQAQQKSKHPEKPPLNGSSAHKKKTSAAPAHDDDTCAGCGEQLTDGQALMALDKNYHVWCFKCHTCSALLHGEYMGKDGYPYCEKDYQAQFGVKCTYCRRFISGKVLQAGDNNHFHPTCARCTKCGEPFGDGEEMFLQGAAIWHPRCGPGPDEGMGGYSVNGFDTDGTPIHSRAGGHDVTSMASAPYYGSRASSPGASLRRDQFYNDSGRFSRSTTHMAGWSPYQPSHGFGSSLYNSSSTYSLRRPIEPGDRVDSISNINHFHLPPSRRAASSRSHGHGTPGTPLHPRASTEHLMATSTPASAAGHGGTYRPISCPPKPGYTQARSNTLPSAYGSAISPGPGMHYSDYDGISQHSFAGTDLGFRGPHFTPSRSSHYPAAPESHQPFSGVYKTYPLHLLFTSNYKLPPDTDRCNLEKHLNDADFEMAFNIRRDDFYTLPLWRRNDLKKRVKLF